ncbi:MAG: aminoglycoside phosphotransferase family protein [Chloroflexi bacterium]|nr:MAG: aminoglycoside phosphotransferase family protein [Chloroflexota bacterium]
MAALRTGWRFESASIEYAAVGFGSHHWVAADPAGSRRFVTVDDLARVSWSRNKEAAFASLSAAFQTARSLRDSGLDFVVAPIPDVAGRALRRLGDSFSVTVFPFLEGGTGNFGSYPSEADRDAARGLIERLHQTPVEVAEIANREDFLLPCRPQVEAALAQLDRPWTAGPYSERTRQLLRGAEPEIRASLRLFDTLVDEVRSDRRPWVITHGEPHAANIIWTAGGPQLIDWDTALIAPAARDLWMLELPGRPGLPKPDPAILLYRLRWDLANIALFVAGFRVPHEDSADAAESWRNLQRDARLHERWSDHLEIRR